MRVYAIYAKIEVTLGRKAAIAAIKAANSGSKEKYEDKKENNTSSVLHNHQETKDIVTVVIDMIKTVINWIIAQWSLWGKDLFNFIIQQSISILFIVIENVKIFINSLNKSESKEEINRQTTLSPSQEGQVGNYIDVKQAVGLIGATMLFFGVFAPLITIPMMGNINYFSNGNGDGVLVLFMSIISFILAWLFFTGLASMAVILFTFINIQIKMSGMKEKMESDLAGNPFRIFADAAIQSIQLQWGLALLFLGAALIIASTLIKDK